MTLQTISDSRYDSVSKPFMIYTGAQRKVDSLAQSFFNKIYVVTFLMAPVAAETVKNDEIKGAFAATVACLFGHSRPSFDICREAYLMNPISKTPFQSKELPFSCKKSDVVLIILFTTLLSQVAMAHDPSIKNTHSINRAQNDTIAIAAIVLNFLPFAMIGYQVITNYLRD